MLASMLLLTSCFKDEGNYDYAEMNPPHWLINANNSVSIVARQGQDAVFDASKFFVWDKDSAIRSQEVRYEWIVNDKVIGEGLVLRIPTEELMEIAGVKDFSNEASTYGTFNVVEKSTGVKYMGKIQVWFYSKFSSDNWIIMTDQGGQVGLSAIRQKYSYVDGVEQVDYELIKDAYGEANQDAKLQGTPINMNWAFDKHISSQGSITVVTDRGGYELRASDLSFYSKIEGEQFLDGTPANFNLVARADCDGSSSAQPATFLASKDGQVYSRVMSLNYLGGKYLSEPYYVDEKGYRITKFGNTLYGNPMIPCYDEKNRRIMMASVLTEQKTDENGDKFFVSVTRLNPLTDTATYVPVNNMPEGTKVLYLGLTNHVPNNTRGCLHFTMAYNRPNETQTRITDFAVYVNTSNTNKGDYFSNSFKLENVPQLDSTSCFLSSGATYRFGYPSTDVAARTTYYTVGNKIYYVQRIAYDMWGKEFKEFELPKGVTINSRITYLALSFLTCNEFIVGCENGDLFIFDITALNAPKLLFQDNLGGKVMSARQLGLRRATSDKFNN